MSPDRNDDGLQLGAGAIASIVGVGALLVFMLQNRDEPQPQIHTDRPLEVVFVAANQTEFESKLELRGPRDSRERPANLPCRLAQDREMGRIDAAQCSGIRSHWNADLRAQRPSAEQCRDLGRGARTARSCRRSLSRYLSGAGGRIA